MEAENLIQVKPTKIAFDLGGVIIERGALQNFIVQQSIISVKLAVQKFEAPNIFIISKAKDKYKQRNIQLLKKNGFFSQVGLLQKNVYFVNQYQQKGPLGKKIGINYIFDDSIKVAKLVVEHQIIPILFGNHEEFIKQNKGNILCAKNWKAVRKFIEKIKKQ